MKKQAFYFRYKSMLAEKKMFLRKYKEMGIPVPEWHFVLGSLIGAELTSSPHPEWELKGQVSFSEIPKLSTPSAPSHKGSYLYFYHPKKNKSLCFQCGRLHGYEGLKAQDVVRTVMGPRHAGTKNFVLSNISGSLKTGINKTCFEKGSALEVFPSYKVHKRQVNSNKTGIKPGEVVAVRDHINLTGQSPLTHLTHQKGFYFLDMDKAYHGITTDLIAAEMQKQALKVQNGVYVGVLGPQFETPAEVALFASYGADVVGMSTVWEVIALHYSKAVVSAFSIVTNMATGLGESVEIIHERLRPCFKKVIKAFFNFANSSKDLAEKPNLKSRRVKKNQHT